MTNAPTVPRDPVAELVRLLAEIAARRAKAKPAPRKA
jgi:hypothetical protein